MKKKIAKEVPPPLVVEQSNKDQSIHTLAAFLNLPESEREQSVWFWPTKWYKEPYALQLGEWDKFHKYVKSDYPVQCFIRNDLSVQWARLSRNFKEAMLAIEYRLIHPRKELIDSVFPPERHDLDKIIVNFCLECVVHYVDNEKCFHYLVWDRDAEHIEHAKMIRMIYDYAKIGRPARLKELDVMWENVPLSNPKISDYNDITLKEKEIEDLDTEYCTWVIKNRSQLWT